MTNTTPTSIAPAIAELERGFDALRPLFPEVDDAPRPILMIQTRGRKKGTLGWMAPQHWENGDPKADPIHEITVCAEALRRGTDDIGETLLHEMVHWANEVQGIKDCAGQRHNKKFKTLAERVGLNVEKQGHRGWAATSHTMESLRDIRAIKFDEDAFAIVRRSFSCAKAPTKMKKWSCSCGTNIRAAVDLDIRCNECLENFERQD